MSSVTCHISISLDGFVAGPHQSTENPIGEGGRRLLTHHPREPLTMQGGTTFTFVTDGIESALEEAGRPPMARTSRSPAAQALCSSTSRPDCSTSATSTSSRSSSAPGSGYRVAR